MALTRPNAFELHTSIRPAGVGAPGDPVDPLAEEEPDSPFGLAAEPPLDGPRPESPRCTPSG